jgi:hypothetical protein
VRLNWDLVFPGRESSSELSEEYGDGAFLPAPQLILSSGEGALLVSNFHVKSSDSSGPGTRFCYIPVRSEPAAEEALHAGTQPSNSLNESLLVLCMRGCRSARFKKRVQLNDTFEEYRI